MKLSALVASSIVVGLALGIGTGLWGTDLFSASSTSGGQALAAGNSERPPLPNENQPHATLEVIEPVYNFGHMERLSRGQHGFVVKNVGEVPLQLRKGPTTCKCTLSQLGEVEVAPGETTEIKLEWDAKGDSPEFRHGATIFTNDPHHSTLKLDIEGTLLDALALNPPEIVFSSLTSDEQVTAKSRLATIRADDLDVVGFTFDDEQTAKFFEVKIEPVDKNDLPEGTKSGRDVFVTIKPGLPPGIIQQKIRLQSNLPDAAPVELKIEGRVGTPVMIVGRDWNQELGLLRLGVIPRDQGLTSDVKIMIRGPHRHEIKLLASQADPDWMQVKLGEPQDLGNVVAVPLTVTIPPHAPVVNHLGNNTGSWGKIAIASDPPELGEIRMNVGFAVAE